MTDHSRQPKYAALANDIREKILRGVYQNGDKLPSENELAGQFHLSRQTVRQALGLLEVEGVLSRQRGSGTYVDLSGEKPQSTKNMTVGVITTYITDYIFPSITRGIEEVLSQRGYHLSLGVTKNRVENESRLLRSFLESGVDGIIVEGTKTAFPNPNLPLYRMLEQQGIPCVFINGYYRELHPAYVVTDDRGCGQQAAEFLLSLGRRRLGGIFKSDDMQGHERYAGFAEGLVKGGGDLVDDYIAWYTTGDKETLFQDNAEYLLERVKHCNGVVCYNDQIAYGLILLLQKHGVRVPEDIAVVSFDNSSISEYSPVKITSFDHPKERLGAAAAEMMLFMAETGKKEMSLVLPMELVVKQSAC